MKDSQEMMLADTGCDVFGPNACLSNLRVSAQDMFAVLSDQIIYHFDGNYITATTSNHRYHQINQNQKSEGL